MYSLKSFLYINVFEIFELNLRKIKNFTELNRNETCSFNVEDFSISKNIEIK